MAIKAGIKINKRVLFSIILALLPVLVFFVSMIYDGISIGSLRIPVYNNDELIYYYQVDGIVNFGSPQGLYGYHEEYSNISSYGAWSPILLINYLIMGKIFGWSAVMAIVYNVAMLSMALFVFGMLARPTFKQTAWISLLYLLYTFTVQGMFSVSPEVTCYSYIIIFLALMYSCLRDLKLYKTVIMFIVATILTLMRPYFLAFMLPAGYFMYKLKGKAAIAVTTFLSLISVYAYGFICVNICSGNPTAATFAKVIKEVKLNNDTSVNGHSPVLTSMLLTGMVDKFIEGLKLNYRQVKWFFTDGNTGRNFINYIAFSIIILIWTLKALRKNRDCHEDTDPDKDKKYLAVFILGYYAVMAFALCIMFPGWAASRHLAQLILMGILIIPMEIEGLPLKMAAALVLIYTMAVVPNGHQEYLSDEKIDEIMAFREELGAKMEPELSGGPTWDNTVLWAYRDSNDENMVTPWQYLFAVPSGFAFNVENTKEQPWLGYKPFSSRYIATIGGGGNEQMCIDRGLKKIAEYDGLVIYKNY